MTKKQSKPARDLYAEITNQLISAIEAGGELPWVKTWEGAGNIIHRHQYPYRIDVHGGKQL